MKRVLIAEDNEEIAAIEKDYLAINGIESDIVSNGITALEMIQKTHFDLLLLDIMMPGKAEDSFC